MKLTSSSARLVSCFLVMFLMVAVCSKRTQIQNGTYAYLTKRIHQKTRCGFRPYDDKALRAEIDRDNLLQRNVSGIHESTSDQNIPILDKVALGHDATYGEYPWQARLDVADNLTGDGTFMFFCGAAVISEYWLLTAAHCVKKVPTESARVFISNHNRFKKDKWEQMFLVDEIIVHERFGEGNYFDCDIALIKIKQTSDGHGIQFNNYAQPLCLPVSEESIKDGTKCMISGWGDSSPAHNVFDRRSYEDNTLGEMLKDFERLDFTQQQTVTRILQGATLPVVNQQKCKNLYSIEYFMKITDRMICFGYASGGSNYCKGDSGGPLVCRVAGVYKVIGIASFGKLACDGHNIPTVCARVTKLLPWIHSKIKKHSQNSAQSRIPRNP